ncbi:hypothetical protein KAT92_05350 [Candidatus Babeliales bacterium]|nr:hypothetical protein [Candidatus Babeliales bacterium]
MANRTCKELMDEYGALSDDMFDSIVKVEEAQKALDEYFDGLNDVENIAVDQMEELLFKLFSGELGGDSDDF